MKKSESMNALITVINKFLFRLLCTHEAYNGGFKVSR